MDKFKVGDRVVHPVFGEGTVEDITDCAVVVQFDSLETRRNINVAYENLKKKKEGITEKELEIHRELAYAGGLVKVLRKYLEDSGCDSIPVLSQVDAISAKLAAIDRMLDG